MRRAGGALATGLAVVAGALAASDGAQAAWTPGPQLLSADLPHLEQADARTTAVVLSGDARYAVIQTQAQSLLADDDPSPAGVRRLGGLFRIDRTTGAVSLVADGDQVPLDAGEPDAGTGLSGAPLLVRGATNPSVSRDGRYVAFQTGQRLVPADTNDNVDVYVRDMDVPLGADRAASGAYSLASARDGTDLPATYAPDEPRQPDRAPGAATSPGSLSADGRYVALRTTEKASDLAGTGPLATPPGTVFVRDRRTRRTTLVSRGLLGGAPVGGATGPLTLSADGTTIAWTGGNAPDQTRFIPGEPVDGGQPYYLWRRWADAGAATRRITGVTDPDDPGCPAPGRVTGDLASAGPCDGPLGEPEQGANDIATRGPALSGDGYTVAYLTGASPRGQDGNPGLDAWLADMRPGVTRKAGNRQLTTDTVAGNARANGDLDQIALSADASTLLFTTLRSLFLLPRPRLVNGARTSLGVVELYAVDLRAQTLERVIRAPGNREAADSASGLPSPSADGRDVAYLSAAGNLVPGDANQVVDAFASTQRPRATAATPVLAAPGGVVSAPPPADAAERLLLRGVRSRRDGTVSVRVVAPRAGRVELLATIPGRTRTVRGRKRRVAPVRVARATAKVARAGSVRVTLRFAAGERARLDRRRRVVCRLDATLRSGGSGELLRAAGRATFRRSTRVR